MVLDVGIKSRVIMGIFEKNTNKDNGANFCHVAKIEHDNRDKEVITEGNHIWHGNIPNLIKIDTININIIMFWLIIWSIHHIEDDDKRNNIEPIACIKKYFNIASVSWYFWEEDIKGINDNMLSSKAHQVNKRLFLDNTINELISIVVINIILNGDIWVDIKIRWSWTIKLMVRSLSFLNLYDDQFRDPWNHSWIKPKNKIKINVVDAIIINILFDRSKIIGIGINKTISISKTIKITANKKNRVEKGIRAEFIGSNPHSNGDIFSRSLFERVNVNFLIIINRVGIIIHVMEDILIIFIWIRNLLRKFSYD